MRDIFLIIVLVGGLFYVVYRFYKVWKMINFEKILYVNIGFWNDIIWLILLEINLKFERRVVLKWECYDWFKKIF